MAWEEDLITRLNGVAAITAITGAAIQWFEFGRGDSGGQIRLTTISPGREWKLDGPDWLDRPRVQFDIRSDDPDEVLSLKRLVLAEMETESTDGSTKFHKAMLEAERTRELGEQPGGGALYQTEMDFMFFHEEV